MEKKRSGAVEARMQSRIRTQWELSGCPAEGQQPQRSLMTASSSSCTAGPLAQTPQTERWQWLQNNKLLGMKSLIYEEEDGLCDIWRNYGLRARLFFPNWRHFVGPPLAYQSIPLVLHCKLLINCSYVCRTDKFPHLETNSSALRN